MVYCDPPYNIGLSYDKGVGMNAGKYQGKYNDSRKDADYSGFIEETLLNALANSSDDAHVFYWCDERYIWLIQTLFEKTGVENKRVCLWIKNKANPVPAIAFNKCYEPCVYGVRGRPFLNGNYRAFDEVLNKEIGGGNRKVEDIIDLLNIWIARLDAGQDYDHPTQKPVTLHEKPLKRCTAPGNIVLDLFGGSGSTLIAAEQLKRRAFLMEQEPVFCQVILNRWERLTGKKAKLLT
jgi:DNA modification methylase